MNNLQRRYFEADFNDLSKYLVVLLAILGEEIATEQLHPRRQLQTTCEQEYRAV
jgi:hypothetical protein